MRNGSAASWLERLGDCINPILVKEARQALKSRQFLITFALLLGACLLVSLAGVALEGPDLSYRSAGARFFVWYFALLSLAVLIAVPFSAYQSLSTEQAERTFELLTITTLQPHQVIAGKLLSAIMQVLVYYSAIAPYMAFAVLLRGIDVPSILLALFVVMLASIGFSMIALLLAALARQQVWPVVLLLIPIFYIIMNVLIMVLRPSSFVFSLLGPSIREPGFWMVGATYLTVYLSYKLLAFQVAAAQLTFEADNRSSKVRITLLLQFLVILGWIAYWWLAASPGNDTLALLICLFFSHWYVVGSFLGAERPGLSARVRRQVPRQWHRRALAAVFFPGPGTGLAFLLANLTCLVLMVVLGQLTLDWLQERAMPPTSVTPGRSLIAFTLASASYVFIYCGLGALVVQAIRRWYPISVLAGAAITWLLAAVGILVPAFFASAFRLPEGQLQAWQFSDPFATLKQIYEQSGYGWHLGIIPFGFAIVVLLFNLRLMARDVNEVHAADQDEAATATTLTMEHVPVTTDA